MIPEHVGEALADEQLEQVDSVHLPQHARVCVRLGRGSRLSRSLVRFRAGSRGRGPRAARSAAEQLDIAAREPVAHPDEALVD